MLRQNRAAVRSDDVSRELAALEQEIAALQAAEQEEDSAVATLEAQVTERRDRLMLTRRAVAEQQSRIEQKRAELEEAMAEDARERFEQIMREREAAAASLAEAAELLLERLAALDRSQDAARAAWGNAQAVGAAGHPWEDAASRSPLGSAITDLPSHLREVARQRRRAMIQRERAAAAKRETE